MLQKFKIFKEYQSYQSRLIISEYRIEPKICFLFVLIGPQKMAILQVTFFESHQFRPGMAKQIVEVHFTLMNFKSLAGEEAWLRFCHYSLNSFGIFLGKDANIVYGNIVHRKREHCKQEHRKVGN